jgi:hypothetical protein
VAAAGPPQAEDLAKLDLHRKILEVQGIPAPDERAKILSEAGLPFVADVQNIAQGANKLRSVHGWIALEDVPPETDPRMWLEPALVARALPGVTHVHLVEGEAGCSLFAMRVERRVLRRQRGLDVRLRRCGKRTTDGVRWVASSEKIENEETGEPINLPFAFVEAIELRADPRYGWILGIRRVELGRPLGPVFSRVYERELRVELARALRHAAPVVLGKVEEELESTSLIE